ncbi:MAG: nucleotidyltransferase domain-containing protein [Candidatus Coatesbacteria bacterium]
MDPQANYDRCLALNPRVGAAIRGAVEACRRAPVRSIICSGSIPLGGYIPRHSDIDLLVVTREPPEGPGWAALLAELGAPSLSAGLIEAGELGKPEPVEIRGLAPRRDYVLHAFDLILLRKYSVVVYGEDVRGSMTDLNERDEITGILAHVRDVMVPAELAKLAAADRVGLAATNILNVAPVMVRCLYTLRHGTLVSKPEALTWAIREFGSRPESAPFVELCRVILDRMTAEFPGPERDRTIPALFRNAVPAWVAAVAPAREA